MTADSNTSPDLDAGDEPQVGSDVFEAAGRALGATVYETDGEAS